ncbi:IclR family transcriptional regulator [Arthrobacter globiformis]|uniref:IclR family transcriptional regulator n=1 Tax=Arthrobacter globiformis TaxID=1665 RepID=UPI0027948A84|nr:IclR family transcriptional regulator [Arthrobacter globiformis]MDQ0618424.1 IclR family acetate operon transcriptional repressor [Arthrobacter globiformis]
MQKTRLNEKPTYSIQAVDNALQLVQLLRDHGRLRLKDAAQELGVAPSTAHRLLAMLVYRGFAVQDEARHYVPGPGMSVGPAGVGWSRLLRDLARPHMELLCSRVNETVNLMIRVGTKVRFLETVESRNALRVGDRQGAVLPANKASGGKAILAELDPALVDQLYTGSRSDRGDDSLPPGDMALLVRELETIRTNGFAANFEGTEEGISALGMALHNPSGLVVGALSVATPVGRFRPLFDAGLVGIMEETRRQIELDIAATPTEG